MRIAVTGRHGQVALSLAERGSLRGYDVIAVGRPELDLSDLASVHTALAAARPDAIVSAAAHTAVDRAERERDIAFAINAAGAGAVAVAAAALRVPIVHLSTDFVFAGTKPDPYVEGDPTGPASVYGASKLAGEQAVLAACADAVILRTAWVFSPFGSNFVKTMLRLAAERDELRVVGDQFGNPTSALAIADGVLDIIERLARDPAPTLRGVFHMTGATACSWAEFAELMFAASQRHGGPSAQVRAIATADYPTPARRPANSRLDCAKLKAAYGIALGGTASAIDTVVARCLAEMSGGT